MAAFRLIRNDGGGWDPLWLFEGPMIASSCEHGRSSSAGARSASRPRRDVDAAKQAPLPAFTPDVVGARVAAHQKRRNRKLSETTPLQTMFTTICQLLRQ